MMTDQPLKLMTLKQSAAIAAFYKDLGFDAKRQEGFNRRICGRPQPLTTEDASKVYLALEAMLTRLIKSCLPQFGLLVKHLYAHRGELSLKFEQGFIADMFTRLMQGYKITPAMIKKTREIAHHYDVPCNFPRLAELAALHQEEHRHGIRYALKT